MAKAAARRRLKQSINGDGGPGTKTMNYIDLAGIKHGSEVDLQVILSRRENIMKVFTAAVESCKAHGTSLPSILKKKGNLMVDKPQNTRAFMVFLRACARLEGAAIFCRKRGTVKDGRATIQSLYKLLTCL